MTHSTSMNITEALTIIQNHRITRDTNYLQMTAICSVLLMLTCKIHRDDCPPFSVVPAATDESPWVASQQLEVGFSRKS